MIVKSHVDTCKFHLGLPLVNVLYSWVVPVTVLSMEICKFRVPKYILNISASNPVRQEFAVHDPDKIRLQVSWPETCGLGDRR
jgi:hypothetical protein